MHSNYMREQQPKVSESTASKTLMTLTSAPPPSHCSPSLPRPPQLFQRTNLQRVLQLLNTELSNG